MHRKQLVLTTAALLGLSMTAWTWGQTSSSSPEVQATAQQQPQQDTTLVGRLNQLGRTIFHGSNARQPKPTTHQHVHTSPVAAQRQKSESQTPRGGLLDQSDVGRRVGSMFSKTEKRLSEILPSDAVRRPSKKAETDLPSREEMSEPPAVTRSGEPTVARTDSPVVVRAEPTVADRIETSIPEPSESVVADRIEMPAAEPDEAPVVSHRATDGAVEKAAEPSLAQPDVATAERVSKEATRPSRLEPLYMRLKSFRQSAFQQHTTRGQVAEAGVVEATDRAAEPEPEQPTPALKTRVTTKSTAIRDRMADILNRQEPHAKLQNPMAARLARPNAPVASQVTEEPRAEAARSEVPEAAVAQSETIDEPADEMGVAEAADVVLFQRQSPVLRVETHGPRRITVGKESTYDVVVNNSGQVAASDLTLIVELPAWAEVTGSDTAAGTVNTSPHDAGSTIEWKVGRLDANSKQGLQLRIVPRESRPFELGVRWTFTPAATHAAIEVQEPKLEVELGGPREVLHGKAEVYRLEINNVGTGPAENLVVQLTPIGPGENVAASHELGSMPAGESRAIEVELTAQHAGDLTIQVKVDGDNGLHAELNEKVVVRQAVLGVQVEGPKLSYVGTSVAFQIAVTNSGDAAARDVRISATLPPGADMVTPSDGGQISRDGKTVEWSLETLPPTSNKNLSFKCDLVRAGAGDVAVTANTDTERAVTDAIAMRVEAIADLVMSVVDPAGPVPIGKDAVYKIRIQNRGTKAAENVEAVGFFSQGVEPVAADGAPQKIATGQVNFGPIPSIPAGGEQVLTVTAQAERAGNHVFRAEVYCRAVGTRLVSEQTTRYYGEDAASYTASRANSDGAKSADK